MTYEDAIESEVSALEAKREIEKHSANFDEFLEDVGDKKTYTGQEVLDWLGY